MSFERQHIKYIILLVTYNAEVFIHSILRSILAQDGDELKRALVIIVDNASKDRTYELISSLLYKANSIDYLIVRLGKNLGFAPGNNIAFELARHVLGDISDKIFILLNPDTRVLKPYFLKVAGMLAKRYPIIGFATLSGNDDVIDSLGAFIDWLGGPSDILCGVRFSSTIKKLYNMLPKLYAVPAACFAAIAIRGDVLKKLGFLRNEYVMYFEDTEWCLRAWSRGIPVIVFKDFMVWHARSGTQKSSGTHRVERFGSIELDVPIHFAKNSLLLTYQYLGLYRFVVRSLLYLLASFMLRRRHLVFAIINALGIIIRRRVKPAKLPKRLIPRNPRTWILLWALKHMINYGGTMEEAISYGVKRASLEYILDRFIQNKKGLR